MIGNPYSNIGTNGNGQVYFNATAQQLATINYTGPNNSLVGPPVLGNLGGGAGDLSLPRVTNFDMTLSKNVPLGSEKRVLRIQAQAYNVFNHTEISGLQTGALSIALRRIRSPTRSRLATSAAQAMLASWRSRPASSSNGYGN